MRSTEKRIFLFQGVVITKPALVEIIFGESVREEKMTNVRENNVFQLFFICKKWIVGKRNGLP